MRNDTLMRDLMTDATARRTFIDIPTDTPVSTCAHEFVRLYPLKGAQAQAYARAYEAHVRMAVQTYFHLPGYMEALKLVEDCKAEVDKHRAKDRRNAAARVRRAANKAAKLAKQENQ